MSEREMIEGFYAKILTAGGGGTAQDAERFLADDWVSVGNYSGQNKDRGAFLKQVGGFMQLMPDLS